MSKKVLDPDTGLEIEMFTAEDMAATQAAAQAELDAKLLEKDKHVEEKLEQFKNGTKSVETKLGEMETKFNEMATETNKQREGVKDFFKGQYATTDEAKAQFDDAWNLLAGIDAKDPAAIQDKCAKAALLAGIAAPAQAAQVAPPMGGFPAYSGYMPQAPAAQNDGKPTAEQHKEFLAETGYVNAVEQVKKEADANK